MNRNAALVVILLAINLPIKAEPVFREKEMHVAPRLPEHITEASGAAISAKDNEFLWVVNDSGGTNEIHLVQSDGIPRGSVKIEGASNHDWEDLAGFSLNGEDFLMIADTGDNDSRRDFCTLYVVREPNLPKNGKSISGEIALAWKIEFSWEGDPRDCESIAIDTKERKIILISKRNSPPEVHELPLRPITKKAVTKKIGITRVIAPSLGFIKIRNQPTAMDICADGSRAVLATYYGLFVFDREKGKTWSDVFAGKSHTPIRHGLAQAEAVALSADGRLILTLSEGKGSHMSILEEVD